MPVAGARALLTATRSHASTAPRVAAAIGCSLSNQTQKRGTRSFQTTTSRRLPPTDDPSATPNSGDVSTSKQTTNDVTEKKDEKASSSATDASGQQSSSVTQKEATTRSQGYGSFRSRAMRTKAVEEFPPVDIPAWFVDEHVLLYDGQVDSKETAALVPDDSGDAAVELMSLLLEGLERDVDFLLKNDDGFEELSPADRLEKKVVKMRGLIDTAYYYALILASPPEARQALMKEYLDVDRPSRPREPSASWSPPWGESKTPLTRQVEKPEPKELKPFDFIQSGPGARQDFHIRDDTERAAYLELLSRARHELDAPIPRKKVAGDAYRPVTVLAVLNFKGKVVATQAIRTVAGELQADVLDLDASSIGLVVGTYLGQTPYWSKGAMSTLGYAAAEMNGRLAAAAVEAADDTPEGTISFNIPNMFRPMRSFPKKNQLQALLGASDDRWEELKLTHALESLLKMAETKRASSAASSAGSSPEARPLIIHIADYIELTASAPEVIHNLRVLVDKMWQKGRRVIILGSSSSDINTVSQWRSQLTEEISKDDCHFVPYTCTNKTWTNHAADLEYLCENQYNIEMMLATLEGHNAQDALRLYEEKYRNLLDGVRDSRLPYLPAILKSSVFSVQTVYRIASLMMGNSKGLDEPMGLLELGKAVKFLDFRDSNWAKQYPNIPPLHPRGASTNDSPVSSWDALLGGNTGEASLSDTANGKQQDYTKEEKKLLTGLINAQDIHTTFDDIVTPEPTKESIKALTSLSLIRPEAYTYGILKTERIPGLLLYGPPGTGKTLLAKAVAKESGANMLEVSAASIMDMYVGTSEKNVQALFSLARKLSPTIIFLDEGDALLGARRGGWERGGTREVITQFLREWDGLTNTNKNAFIIVATNRPFDLDEAVLRRLPRKMLVDLPLQDEREAILRILLKEETLDESTVSLATLAAETDLYSGSDLKNLCVAAAMEAVKQEMRDYTAAGSPKEGYVWPEKRILTRKHFDAAVKEIGASISEDMESLKAIRKFDERYGDGSGKQKKKKRSMGFEVVPAVSGTEAARVRTLLA